MNDVEQLHEAIVALIRHHRPELPGGLEAELRETIAAMLAVAPADEAGSGSHASGSHASGPHASGPHASVSRADVLRIRTTKFVARQLPPALYRDLEVRRHILLEVRAIIARFLGGPLERSVYLD